ncbi:MAG: hypothetical protein ACFFDR_13905 [Candidatus Thorarchaeota archaeon]
MLFDLALVCIFGILIFILAGITFGRGPQSARVRVTRPSSRSVDGFGGTRGYDYSYAPVIRDSTMPFPVGQRVQRVQTKTFRQHDRR